MQGWTEQRIADHLGKNQSTISRWLGRMEAAAFKRLAETVDRTKARQVHQLEHIQDEAMQAFERTKGARLTHQKKAKSPTDGDGKVTGDPVVFEEKQTLVEQAGDPRHLEQARGAMSDIRKILGIDRTEPEPPVNLSDLTKEAEAMAAGYRPDERPETTAGGAPGEVP